MKKPYLSKFKIKDKVAKAELARAHGMIILLVIALTFVLTLASSGQVELDPMLSFIAIFLLSIVGVISLWVLISVSSKK
jgi:hypothetical protein